jgi:hypothetical protein
MTISALSILWFVLGLVFGAAFIFYARKRSERRVFAYGLVAAAMVYVGFALAGSASSTWIAIEIAGVVFCGILAVFGIKHSQWWLALGWGLHPVWDVCIHLVGKGAAFAPAWYVVACLSFDVLVAGYIIMQLRRQAKNTPAVTD